MEIEALGIKINENKKEVTKMNFMVCKST